MDPYNINDFCLYTWKENDNLIDCNRPSTINNSLCDHHQQHIVDITEIIKLNTRLCTNELKKKLDNNITANNNQNKIITSIQLFEFLVKHKHFLYSHKKFSDTLLGKLYEFGESDKDVFDAQKYIQLLYPKLFTNNINNIIQTEMNNEQIEISI